MPFWRNLNASGGEFDRQEITPSQKNSGRRLHLHCQPQSIRRTLTVRHAKTLKNNSILANTVKVRGLQKEPLYIIILYNRNVCLHCSVEPSLHAWFCGNSPSSFGMIDSTDRQIDHTFIYREKDNMY